MRFSMCCCNMLKLLPLPGIEPLPEAARVKVFVRLNGEGQPRVGVGRRLALVIDVDHFSVGQNFPFPSERKRSGDPLLSPSPRMRPLGRAGVVVGVKDVAVCKFD
jgi:hypothetical protein